MSGGIGNSFRSSGSHTEICRRPAGFPKRFGPPLRPREAKGRSRAVPGSSADDLLNFAEKEVGLGERDTPTPGEEVRDLAVPERWREEGLLEGCRAGDLAAFERLYEIEAPRMKSIAMNLLHDVAEAEDAVQEAFLKIYRGAKTFRGGAAFSTWTYRVLVNTCYDVLRRRRTRPSGPSLDAADGPPMPAAAPVADHPLRVALERAVARLKPKHRTVFLLFEVEGFTHAEIARILGIPEGTSKTFLFDAKKKLQRWLGGAPGAARAAAS